MARPLVVDESRRLFGEGDQHGPILVHSATCTTGVLNPTYQPAWNRDLNGAKPRPAQRQARVPAE
jgi:hypothetical protein